MLENNHNYLYKLAWEYHPNALIAVNSDLEIQLVNPAFCTLFKLESCAIKGQLAVNILGDIEHLKSAWKENKNIENSIKEYPKPEIFVKEFIYPIEEKNLILCIMMNLTSEIKQKKELTKMQEQMIKQVNNVVNNQMKVAQRNCRTFGGNNSRNKS